MKIAIKELEIATEGLIISKNKIGSVSSISTDTRNDCADSLFIPLVGDNHDAHNYINRAFEKGAVATLTDRDVDIDDEFSERVCIKVQNTLDALGKLASWYRLRFSPIVVGITGSVGKTTTKDLIALVMSKKFNVLKTPGNYNNEIGLPLTVFGLNEKHDAMVLEMGMNSLGEISKLSKIARPDSAVITNVGLAHIEKLGSKQNILKAKLEIIEGQSKTGTLFLNGDDALLNGLRGLIDRQIVYYGIDEALDVIATDIKLCGDVGVEFEFQWQQKSFRAKLLAAGVHNVHNALAAIAVGLQYGVKPEHIVEAIGEYRSGSMRLNIIDAGEVRIIDDSYNANPQSMNAAIDVVAEMECKGRKIVAFGDMLELGRTAKRCHYEVGEYAAAKGVDVVLAVGAYSRYLTDGANSGVSGARATETHAFREKKEMIEFLESMVGAGDIILVKGSRGTRMEEVVRRLNDRFKRDIDARVEPVKDKG